MPDGPEHRRSSPSKSQRAARRRRERAARTAALDVSARRLIAEHVDSVGALDLLVLVRDRRGHWLTADDVCDALRCPRGWAVLQLEGLHAAELLEANGDEVRRYRFGPRDDAAAAAVDALAEAYAASPRDVVKLIFSLRA